MKFTILDIIGYILKWKYVVIIVVIATLLVAKIYTNKNQSYTAQTVIRYTDPSAKSGLTPAGEKLDVYEILSPSIISAAITELGIDASVENVRENCVVLPIIPDDEEEKKKSQIKEGKEYNFFATDYVVKYTVGNHKSGEYARDMLDAIIKNYNTFYSEKYLTQSVLPEIEFDINSGNYDYLETAEIMNDKIKTAISYLQGKSKASADFRSPSSGYSFADLEEKYTAIKQLDLPALFSNILRGQITKNEDVLIKKYAYKQEQLWLQYQSKQVDTNTALELMNEFVNTNKQVPNSYNNDEEKNGNFKNQDIFINEEAQRTKTTYDNLVDKYVADGVKAGEIVIDANYCQSIIEIFNKPMDANIDTVALTNTVENEIKIIYKNIRNLFSITDKTINDFNQYSASQKISMLSGVSISINLPVDLYMLIAGTIGILLGIVAAIAIEYLRINKKTKVEYLL